ncbi:MAG: TaqI-like C-terminal specificity domain-containing protein [Candidatus Acidiferrum sp.]
MIVELVEHFARNADVYRTNLNEAEVRVQFIDPFFEALGWDIHNKKHYGETYKDVIHEYSLRSAAHTEAPDYCFQVGGTRKFYVEAKRPAVHISADPAAAYQLRSYAWTSKLPLSLLSNFAEFAVYDCRILPRPKDKASVARIDLITFDQYPSKWEDIASRFSREAVYQGSFDRYTESSKLRKGTAEVDDAFLAEIESWRKELASNIALRNPSLTQREVNFAVQRTIDRLIFLRICEDRGIEKYGQLQEIQQNEHIYRRLCTIYERADEKYNSGLFHFTDEKDRAEAPDKLTPLLKIDDTRLRPILKRLYYPDSPYQFSHFPADILGQVYEQFLGQVIRLTPGHQAKVEPKPEVLKAHGVYYTPTYVVEYIVRNTIGKLLEGKSPKQVSKLRVLDPACGSGSFLLIAFQFLMNWHRDEYLKDGAERHQKELYQAPGADWRLTTAEKKRILLNSIYGVDIDSQAVEVTKLSLLLKVLEGESEQTLGTNLRLFHERALPDLGNNIKCGNALIGSDFYKDQQLPLIDEEQRYRVNAFDWEDEFASIIGSGGFDAVIGNPPYIFTRSKGLDEQQKDYFYARYKHQSGQLNTFGIFVERSHALISKYGWLGFITPNNWLTIDSFWPLRKFVLGNTAELRFVNILDRVFAAANVDTAITVLKKGTPGLLSVAEMKNGGETFLREVPRDVIKAPSFIIQIGLLKNDDIRGVLTEIASRSLPLSKFCTVSTGLKAYQTGKGHPRQTDYQKRNRVFHANSRISRTYGKYLDGVDVRRYELAWSGEYLNYGDWLAEPRKSVPFSGERILVRQIPAKPPYLVHAVLTDKPFYNDINSMVLFDPGDGISLKYLLGLINSKLMSFWFSNTFDKLQRRIFPQFKVRELGSFPIHEINLSSAGSEERYEKLVQEVERMLRLHRELSDAKTEHENTMIQRQIQTVDQEIDQIVYKLYGLADNQIALVEGRENSRSGN